MEEGSSRGGRRERAGTDGVLGRRRTVQRWEASRIVWVTFAGTVVGTGLALFLTGRSPGPALLVVSISVLGGFLAWTARGQRVTRAGVRRDLRRAVVVELFVLAAWGLIAAAGPAGGSAVVAVLVSHPMAWRWAGRRLPRVADETGVGHPELLSTTELTDRWRATTAAVRSTMDARARRLLADHRHAWLRELEVRDPEGVQRWLDSGPRDMADVAGALSPGRPERRV